MIPLRLLIRRLRILSTRQVLHRCYTLLKRYGLSGRRYRRSLREFVRLMKRLGIKPTLPVTARVLERHPQLFLEIQDDGAELAAHGLRHIDYTDVFEEMLREHAQKAQVILQDFAGIDNLGHRFPFLRKNEGAINLIGEQAYRWDSSVVVSWNSLDSGLFEKQAWNNYQNILKTYDARDADEEAVLPYFIDGLVEIPVSVPDDDILVERLGLDDSETMKVIWKRMVCRARERGDLLVMQVHPERYHEYKASLEAVLRFAVGQNDVWLASLNEVADWWRDRDHIAFNVSEVEKNRYRIAWQGSKRATVLVKNNTRRRNKSELWGGAVAEKSRAWEIESPVRPMIGLHPNSSHWVGDFLKREGFVFEISDCPEAYSLFLNLSKLRDRKTEIEVWKKIDRVKQVLIRVWRWPGGARYALSVTGDVDAVDLIDYWGRFHG